MKVSDPEALFLELGSFADTGTHEERSRTGATASFGYDSIEWMVMSLLGPPQLGRPLKSGAVLPTPPGGESCGARS